MRIGIPTMACTQRLVDGRQPVYHQRHAGNPELRPFRANAADLSFEKYLGHRRAMSRLQLFYKYFDTFVVEQNLSDVPFDYTRLPDPDAAYHESDRSARSRMHLPSAAKASRTGSSSRPYNVNGGKMYGAELGANPSVRRFDSRARRLRHDRRRLATRNRRSDIYPGGTPATTLPGYSKWVANGTLYFEKWGFSARGSVRYRSSFQGEVSGFGARPNVFRQA